MFSQVCINEEMLPIYIYISPIGLVDRVFVNGLGDWGFNPRLNHIKDLKKNKTKKTPPCLTQHYKVCIKGKVEQSRERSNALLYTLV